MSEENELIDGLFFKLPHDNAPDFVKGKLSIKKEDFKEWFRKELMENKDDEWINIQLLVSKGGNPYALKDNWKPEPQDQFEAGVPTDDIPF